MVDLCGSSSGKLSSNSRSEFITFVTLENQSKTVVAKITWKKVEYYINLKTSTFWGNRGVVSRSQGILWADTIWLDLMDSQSNFADRVATKRHSILSTPPFEIRHYIGSQGVMDMKRCPWGRPWGRRAHQDTILPHFPKKLHKNRKCWSLGAAAKNEPLCETFTT